MPREEDESSLSRRGFLETGGTAAAGIFALAPTLTSSHTAEPFSDPPLQNAVQYKWLGLEAIVMIEDGRVDEAIEHLEKLLETYHNDPEFLYGLAVAFAQKNDFNRAADYAQRAVDAGLPFSRFQAGPRALLQPFYASEPYSDLEKTYGRQLVHGPLVGTVTSTSASFWVRTADEVLVQVELSRPGNSSLARVSDAVRTRSDREFTGILEVEGLEADTAYDYRLVIDGEEVDDAWQFRTFPPEGEPAAFEIGFGGCAGYTPKHERMWRTINEHDLPAFLLTGDNVYIDQPEHPAGQQYCYYRRQSRPEFRAFTSSQAIFAIWDDHDFSTDDSAGGPDIDSPAWKVPVWEIFRNNWNNPSYGGGEDRPGCWFHHTIADADFFMLDDRMYRTEPGQDSATMLGPHQKEWLFESLSSATGTFKFIVTSVPWAYGAKPGSLDPWQGYKNERAEIFSFLHEQRIEGAVLLAGDRHRADVWKIERAEGYDLYEFQNAQLTNIHTHQTMEDAEFSYNASNMFGKLVIDTTRSDPSVTYEIVSIDNEPIHSKTVHLSQVSYGA